MVVYGVNMFGDALRDLLDPRLRGARALGGGVSDEERRATYETAWAEGGYAFIGSFSDITRDLRANNTASEFIRAKIRAIVKDRETADKLVPRDHPPGP